jgi:hypothetical protein
LEKKLIPPMFFGKTLHKRPSFDKMQSNEFFTTRRRNKTGMKKAPEQRRRPD